MAEFTTGTLEEGGDALVVGVGSDRAWDEGAAWVVERLGDRLAGYFDAADFSGKPGQSIKVPGGNEVPYDLVVFVGFGDTPDDEAVRMAAGTAGLATSRSATVVTTLHTASADGAAAVAMGLLLGQYRFDAHRSKPKPSLTETVRLVGANEADMDAAGRAVVIADAVALVRDLVNTPAVDKSPETLAGVAMDIGEHTGVRVVVHDLEACREAGFGGLLGVNAGADAPARMVELWYEPEQADAFVAFVGKGIVFDSGGLSIKPAAGMEAMKTDMSGAAAVFGAVQAIATLGLPVKVLGVAPLTENLTGGSATKPGDVLKIRNGKTIEVLNTDAEGRLVLADGLSLAVEYEPDLVIDIATLTGACVVALGEKIAGVLGTGDAPDRVADAAGVAGERIWVLPMPDDYRKLIESDVADMKNIGGRYGGTITAALLLEEFVGDVPWAHIDIAGPARSGEVDGYIVKGATGFGVRTLVAIAESMTSS